MDLSDRVVVCARSDVASLMQVREKAPLALERSHGRVCLAMVGGAKYSDSEIEGFTGLPVVGKCPFDHLAAAVAAGEKTGVRRLRRSSLVSAAAALASSLAPSSGVWEEPGSSAAPTTVLPDPLSVGPLESIR